MSKNKKKNIPLLPFAGLLVYPTMILHIDVGRERSVFAIEHAIAQDNLIFLATQQDTSIENPKAEDLYEIGRWQCEIVDRITQWNIPCSD